MDITEQVEYEMRLTNINRRVSIIYVVCESVDNVL